MGFYEIVAMLMADGISLVQAEAEALQYAKDMEEINRMETENNG